MSPQSLPPAILSFLRRRIAGIEELEVVLWMRRTAARGWTAAAIAESLDLPESTIASALEVLFAAKLVERLEGDQGEERFVYHPATPELESAVASLAEIYEEQRADILWALNDNAVGRIRAAAVRTFAGGNGNGNGNGRGRRGDGAHDGKREQARAGDGSGSREHPPGKPRSGRSDGHVGGSRG